MTERRILSIFYHCRLYEMRTDGFPSHVFAWEIDEHRPDGVRTTRFWNRALAYEQLEIRGNRPILTVVK